MTHRTFTRTARLVTVAGVAAGSLAVGGAAYAASTPASPAAPSAPGATSGGTSGSTAQGGAALGHRGLLARTVHAELVIRTKTGYRTVDIDRGTVNTVSSTQISITRPDGPTVTEKVDSATKFRGRTESQLTPGTKAMILSSDGTAISVRSAATGSGTASGATGSSTTTPAG